MQPQPLTRSMACATECLRKALVRACQHIAAGAHGTTDQHWLACSKSRYSTRAGLAFNIKVDMTRASMQSAALSCGEQHWPVVRHGPCHR